MKLNNYGSIVQVLILEEEWVSQDSTNQKDAGSKQQDDNELEKLRSERWEQKK